MVRQDKYGGCSVTDCPCYAKNKEDFRRKFTSIPAVTTQDGNPWFPEGWTLVDECHKLCRKHLDDFNLLWSEGSNVKRLRSQGSAPNPRPSKAPPKRLHDITDVGEQEDTRHTLSSTSESEQQVLLEPMLVDKDALDATSSARYDEKRGLHVNLDYDDLSGDGIPARRLPAESAQKRLSFGGVSVSSDIDEGDNDSDSDDDSDDDGDPEFENKQFKRPPPKSKPFSLPKTRSKTMRGAAVRKYLKDKDLLRAQRHGNFEDFIKEYPNAPEQMHVLLPEILGKLFELEDKYANQMAAEEELERTGRPKLFELLTTAVLSPNGPAPGHCSWSEAATTYSNM